MACARNLNAKSYFESVVGKFVWFCIAVQNFKTICSTASPLKRRINAHFVTKISLSRLNLCVYLICIQLPTLNVCFTIWAQYFPRKNAQVPSFTHQNQNTSNFIPNIQ